MHAGPSVGVANPPSSRRTSLRVRVSPGWEDSTIPGLSRSAFAVGLSRVSLLRGETKLATSQIRAWGQNVGDCPDFAAARGAKWDCPPLRGRFVPGSYFSMRSVLRQMVWIVPSAIVTSTLALPWMPEHNTSSSIASQAALTRAICIWLAGVCFMLFMMGRLSPPATDFNFCFQPPEIFFVAGRATLSSLLQLVVHHGGTEVTERR